MTTETRPSAIVNDAIASLKSTSDQHTKDLQEIHKITSVHTRTLNEMSQQLVTILQKLNAAENREPNLENLHPRKSYQPQLDSKLVRTYET